MALASPPRCRLLALPAELRCLVWEFTFTRSDDQQIDLRTAHPPDGTLLLTCRQVHAEAQEYFVAGHQNFWTDSHFIIPYDKRVRATSAINLSDSRLHLITRLSFLGKVVDFYYNGGIWTHVAHDQDVKRPAMTWYQSLGQLSCPDRAIASVEKCSTSYYSDDPRLPGVRFPASNRFLDLEHERTHECYYCELPLDMSDDKILEVKQIVGWQPLSNAEFGA